MNRTSPDPPAVKGRLPFIGDDWTTDTSRCEGGVGKAAGKEWRTGLRRTIVKLYCDIGDAAYGGYTE